jgi:glycerol-3-phosphate dehydrogenase (NAD(P)+)
MTTVAIVGAGMMGTAVAWPLSDNGHLVRLVGTHLDDEIIRTCRRQRYHPTLKRGIPTGVTPYFAEDIAEALDGVEIIVSGVNSHGVHWIGRAIGPYLRPGQLVIAVTKGLEVAENGDLLILPDVVASELPEDMSQRVTLAAIGGPCIAGELAGRRHSYVVFGARNRDAVERLAVAFRTPYYRVWTTTDLVGLEVCAALKNAYALGVGLVAGWMERSGGTDSAGAHMHNLAAALFAQGCAEMNSALRLMGATRALACQLPGAGDLYVTCQGGRNVRLGRLLGLGHSYAEAEQIMAGETLEGAEMVRVMGKALPKLVARGLAKPLDFPLMRVLVRIIVEGAAVDRCLQELFPAIAPTASIISESGGVT